MPQKLRCKATAQELVGGRGVNLITFLPIRRNIKTESPTIHISEIRKVNYLRKMKEQFQRV